MQTLAIALIAIVSTGVSAQVRCTMPNGIVIEQKLSKECPVGASKGETLDGKPIAIKLPPEPTPTAPKATATPEASQSTKKTDNSTAIASTAFDDAQLICESVLSTNIATSCDVDSSIFSTSVIDMTLPNGAAGANMLCNELKTQMKRANRPIVSRGSNWEIHFFSPYGSSDRPVARCVL